MLARSVIPVLALVLLFGPLLAKADTPMGVWGGDQAQLTLTASGGTLNLGCGQARFDGPLRLDAEGRFHVSGALQVYGAGAQSADRPPAWRPAVFSGQVKGHTLQLSVRSAAGEDTYNLVEGARPKIVRCL